MNKLRFISIPLSLFAGLFMLAGTVMAATDGLTLRVTQPKSPTNQRSFDLSFVSMDIDGRTISVRCELKGAGEGGFSPVGSIVSLPAGGGSGSCHIPENEVDAAGNYEYRVTSTAGGDSVSSTVVVTYSNIQPHAPSDFRKEKLSNCDYRITFRTSDDTDRVELYRSENNSFNVDSGTKVSGINIGSNQTGQITNSVPDCQKTYYFALRAFNSSGNASPIVGDSDTIVINPTIVTRRTVGPIPVSTGGDSEVSPEVLGEGTETGSESAETGTPTGASGMVKAAADTVNSLFKSPWAWVAGIGAVALLFFLSRRKNNQQV